MVLAFRLLTFPLFVGIICDATLIIRYEKASMELRERIESEHSDVDFLKTYNLEERFELCKETASAREYVMISPDAEIPPEYTTSTSNVLDEKATTKNSDVVDAPHVLREGSSTRAPHEGQDSPEMPHESAGEQRLIEEANMALGATPKKETSSPRENVSPEISPENDSQGRDVKSEISPEFEPEEDQQDVGEMEGHEEQDRSLKRQRRESKNKCLYIKRRINLLRGIFPRVMRCSNPDGKEFFVTYGHRRTDLFLLEYRYKAPGLVVKALIPPTPSYKFRRPNEVLTTFLRELEIGENRKIQIPANLNLCFLTKIGHLRLCASAFDALVRVGWLAPLARKLNFVTVGQTQSARCHNTSVRLNADVQLQKARVVPCFVNRFGEDSQQPQFYVLPSAQETASAFILTTSGAHDKEMTITMKIDNVDVLFEADMRSEFVRGRPSIISGMGMPRPGRINRQNVSNSPRR